MLILVEGSIALQTVFHQCHDDVITHNAPMYENYFVQMNGQSAVMMVLANPTVKPKESRGGRGESDNSEAGKIHSQ